MSTFKERVWHMRLFISVYMALCTQQWFRQFVVGGFYLCGDLCNILYAIMSELIFAAGPSVITMGSVGYITYVLITMWNSDRNI